jgi:hypothetical protein
MKLFILYANISANKHLSFSLINSGREFACRCYTNAFNECGYKAQYFFENPNELSDITADLCKKIYKKTTNDETPPNDNDQEDNIIYMMFEYKNKRKRVGGKRSWSKRKTKKTKKSRKIKR